MAFKVSFEQTSAHYVIAAILLTAFVLVVGYSQFESLFMVQRIDDHNSYQNAIEKPQNEYFLNVMTIILFIVIVVLGLRLVMSLVQILAGGITGSNGAVSIPPFSYHVPNNLTGNLKKAVFVMVIVAMIGLCGYTAYAQFETVSLLNRIHTVNNVTNGSTADVPVIGWFEKWFHALNFGHDGNPVIRDPNVLPVKQQQLNVVKSSNYIIIVYLVLCLLSLVVFHFMSTSGGDLTASSMKLESPLLSSSMGFSSRK
jgi:hypothetical protein